MNRWGTWGIAALVLAGVGGGALAWTRSRVPDTRASNAAPNPASPTLPPDALGRASQQMLPKALSGVFLGMDAQALNQVRPRAARRPQADEPGFTVFIETLTDGAGVVYSLDQNSGKLVKVQLALQLPGVEAIAPRVASLQGSHGMPSGVWDCPSVAGQQLPTRRFTWTRGLVGAMDVYVIFGDRVAATQYFAPTSVIRDSIARAKCVATPPERFAKFPEVGSTPPTKAPQLPPTP